MFIKPLKTMNKCKKADIATEGLQVGFFGWKGDISHICLMLQMGELDF